MAAEPRNPGVRVTHAGILMALGDVNGSIERYQALLQQMPRDSELHQSLGHAYKTNGESAKAIESYRRAIEVRPDFGEAYWSLANLKTYRFTDAELERMRHYEAQPYLQQADRYHLCFALGKALEDRGDYAESFIYYDRGNALKKERQPLPTRRAGTGGKQADGTLSRPSFSPNAAAGAALTHHPYSCWACRVRAPRCSSRSWLHTHRWKARWSSPTSRGSSVRSVAAISSEIPITRAYCLS